jgi:hypothetical protein
LVAGTCTAFTFRDEAGHFTAHKTRAGNQRGGAYWRATRRRHGRLFSYYLGPSARLTPEHLRQAALLLSGEYELDVFPLALPDLAQLPTQESLLQYGLECLQSCGEWEAANTAHAAYYLRLSEEVEPHLRGAEHGRWVAQLEREQENLRAALGFLLEQAHTQAGTKPGALQAEQALRLCIALSRFWNVQGSGREGLSYLMSALAESEGVEAALRANALAESASLAFIYARHLPLEQMAEESLAIYQELGDAHRIANSLYRLGTIVRIRSQFTQVQAHLGEAANRFQALGDRWRQGRCYTERARVAIEQGLYEQAQARLSKSLLLYQEQGDPQYIAWVYYLQAYLLFVQLDDQARCP